MWFGKASSRIPGREARLSLGLGDPDVRSRRHSNDLVRGPVTLGTYLRVLSFDFHGSARLGRGGERACVCDV